MFEAELERSGTCQIALRIAQRRFAQQGVQLGDVGRDPPSLVFVEQLGRQAASGLRIRGQSSAVRLPVSPEDFPTGDSRAVSLAVRVAFCCTQGLARIIGATSYTKLRA
jgi:hypothetical protein